MNVTLTKREAFAMAALGGLLAGDAPRKIAAATGLRENSEILQELVRSTVQIANALVAELERTKP